MTDTDDRLEDHAAVDWLYFYPLEPAPEALTVHLSLTNRHGVDSADTTHRLPSPAGELSVSLLGLRPTDTIVAEGEGWHLTPVEPA